MFARKFYGHNYCYYSPILPFVLKFLELELSRGRRYGRCGTRTATLLHFFILHSSAVLGSYNVL